MPFGVATLEAGPQAQGTLLGPILFPYYSHVLKEPIQEY